MDDKPVETMRDDGKTRVYAWKREDIAKIKDEPAMPDAREMYPQVQVTTYKDWDEFAKWWSSMIRDQYILTDEMRAKVKELTAGKEERMDKIRAIYDFVTGEIKYLAWEFGPHGYQPYTATQIFEGKNGDCKDKALLFNTMLKEIGVEGYPVLLNADDSRSEEDLTLAQVGHFNHCIAYVPDTDGKGTGRFFDGTAEYASAYLPPMMDQGARVLVVKPEGAELMTIPKGAPETFGIQQKWNVKVHDDGSATATCDMTWRGDMAVQMRHLFSVEGQRGQILQGLFTRGAKLGKLKITEQKFDELKDLSKPETAFHVTLEVDKFVGGSGDARTLPAGFLDTGDLGGLVDLKTREHDLVVSTAMDFHTEADYELPAGWSVVAPPEDAKVELKYAAFTSTATSDGTKLHLVRDMRLYGERVKAADYPAFRESATKAAAVTKQQWKVKKGEAAPSPESPAPASAAPAEKPPEAVAPK